MFLHVELLRVRRVRFPPRSRLNGRCFPKFVIYCDDSIKDEVESLFSIKKNEGHIDLSLCHKNVKRSSMVRSELDPSQTMLSLAAFSKGGGTCDVEGWPPSGPPISHCPSR